MAIRLRVEPYDPDAIDADGDGIVQEGTAWERPAGTRLISELGQDIQRGLTSMSRPNLRVVDRNGTPVKYTPRYGGVASAGAPSGRAQESFKLRTLADMGVQTLEQILYPETLAPKSISSQARPSVPEAKSQDSERIINRNKEIANEISRLGGSVTGDFGQDYIDQNQEFAGYVFDIETPRQAFDRREQLIKEELAGIREAIKNGVVESSGFNAPVPFATRLAKQKTATTITPKVLESLSPAVKDMIMTKSDDELFEIMERRAMDFHETMDKRPRVRIGSKDIFKFASEGRYKTTHEAKSDHSAPDVRAKYEASLGFPPTTPADMRPASGYIVHPDWEEAEIKALTQSSQRSADEARAILQTDSFNGAGNVSIYGSLEIVLKEEVSGRTRYGRGDSLTAGLRPVPLDSNDPEAVMHAINWAGGVYSADSPLHTAALLQTEVDGDFGFLNLWHTKWNPDGTRNRTDRGDRKYFEALIGGSFTVDDVDEVRVAATTLAQLGLATDEVNLREIPFAEQFASPERLRGLGFTEGQIAYMMEQYRLNPTTFASFFNDYRTYVLRKKGKEELDKMPFKTTIVGDIWKGGKQLDPLDPTSYGGHEKFPSTEALLMDRVKTYIDKMIELEARVSVSDYDPDESVA